MQDSFTSPSGFITVSFPDAVVARPRLPKTPGTLAFVALLPATDIKMAWLGNYPDHVARLRPIHPNWVGTDRAAVFTPAIAPLSWMPTLLGFLAAPRLHQIYYRYVADPLSGDMMTVAQQMAWDARPKAPFTQRPRLRAGQAVLVIPTTVIAAGQDCVELVDVALTHPSLAAQAVVGPTFLDEALTVPNLTTEGLC